MKSNKTKLLALVTSFLLASPAYAECTLATDIVPMTRGEDSGFWYTIDCHREVGRVFLENKDRKKQIEAYQNLLDLSNQRYDIQKERADLWYQTSKDLEERVRKIDEYDRTENMFYLIGGVVLTVAAGWAVGQASK